MVLKMEKDIATEPQPLGRPDTMDETPRKPSAGDDTHSLERHESEHSDAFQDMENQNPDGLDLSRTVSSGPPYTIYNHTTKMFILASVSVSSLISPFGATTFYPALNTLAEQLNVTPTMVNLSLTTYMVRKDPQACQKPADDVCFSRSLKQSPLQSSQACPTRAADDPRS